MAQPQPPVRVIQKRCAPNRFPCPQCAKRGRRKATHTRRVRDMAYQQILILELTTGEYRATCGCCKTFRSQVPGIHARAHYTNRVRDAVIDRLLDDHMNMERLRLAMHRDFCLDLSDGFLYDCLDWKVRQVDMPEYRQWTLQQFSGTLCVDEVHLGHRTLLLATDPLGDFPVAFALVRSNDQNHMQRFLNHLKSWGFLPRVVITDGSNLYPKVLAQLWPAARHQLCVFHVLKDIHGCVLDALRRIKKTLAGKTKRKRRRGRPTKAQKRLRARQAKTKKEQAYFIWKHRHLIVTREENLTAQDRQWLSQMLEYAPGLKTLCQFVRKVQRLFDLEQTPHQARCRRRALVKTQAFLADPDLVRAMEMLSAEKFAKMVAYLHSPAGQRLRTNNHVERVNRRLRYLEKVRYRWRRRRTIVRFLVLALDRWKAQYGDPRTPQAHRSQQQANEVVTERNTRPQTQKAADSCRV